MDGVIGIKDASTTQKGVSRFATATEVANKTNVTAAITPANVAQMFVSTPFSETFPSGRVLKWGVARYTGGLQSFTFDSPFPNGILHFSISTGNNVYDGLEVMNYVQYNNIGFSAYASALTDYPYFAIGY